MEYTFKWKLAQSLELFWWKRYLRGKDKATYLTWKRNYWTNLLDKLPQTLNLQPSARILDAGCGPAGVFIALPDNVTIDAVDPLIDKYQQDLPFFNPQDYPNVNFIHSPLEAYTTNTQYNYIFCMNCLNHVSDIQKAIAVLASTLKEAGTLILTIDAHNYSFFKHLFRLIPGDMLHPHQYDLAEYEALLEKEGLKSLDRQLIKKDGLFDHYLITVKRQSKYPTC